jgi:hypothetical protein
MCDQMFKLSKTDLSEANLGIQINYDHLNILGRS